MTVSVTTRRISYTGDGSTTAFAIPWYFLLNAHIKVITRVIATGVETTKTLTTDYTLTGAGNTAGGTLTMLSAPASTVSVVITRNVPYTQLVDYVTGEAAASQSTEDALDKLTMICLMQADMIERSARLSEGAAVIDLTMPLSTANYVLAFNSGGTGLTALAPAALASVGDAPVVVTVPGTTRTAASTESNTLFVFNSASTCTLTLPDDAATNGYTIYAINRGTGSVEVSTADTVLNSYTTVAGKTIGAITKVAADTWVMSGDVS